ncbi:MAG: hypothetical protein ACJA2K_001213 [Thalassolituus sp.]|jgi:hypothetical protein
MTFTRRLAKVITCIATISLSIALATTANAAEFDGLTKERLYVTAGTEFSRFTPETQGSEFTAEDVHDWGFGVGVGYDLLDQLAIEWDYSNKGELLATSDSGFVNTGYNYTTVTANWFPDLWYANRRYDDDWPNKINWYLSGGLSRLFVSGSANTELENNVNVMVGAGVTYGFDSKLQLRGSIDRVSGDVLTFGLSLMWYPFAPEGRGERRGRITEDDVPVYVPFQVAKSIAKGEANNMCQFTKQEETVVFSSGSYLVTKGYLGRLNQIADRFFKCPNVRIVLVGIGEGSARRDEQPIEFRRNDAVARYLIKRGVPSNKIVMTTQSYADVARGSDKNRVDVYFGR